MSYASHSAGNHAYSHQADYTELPGKPLDPPSEL